MRSHHRSYRLLHQMSLLPISGVVLFSTLLTGAQARTTLDGSLDRSRALTGPNYSIPAAVWQVRGRNLFHSFGQFNVPAGERVIFTGLNEIANILSRVTKSQPSTIDGRLRSEIAGANPFLLNPSEMVFGPNASLAVKGAFHVRTADSLRLADGAIFRADRTAPSVLSVAPPAVFGFLAQPPAGTSVQEICLEVPEGRSRSLVGGDVRIVGGPTGFFLAPSGRMGVVSATSPSEATFDTATQMPDITRGSFACLGSIALSIQAFLDTAGNPSGAGGGGTVVIRGGRLMMTDASEVRSNTLRDADRVPIGTDVRVAGDAVVDNSFIQTTPECRKRGGVWLQGFCGHGGGPWVQGLFGGFWAA